MREQTFYDWLIRETATSRMALVGLYEKRDHLLYVQAPALRKKYMDVIGVYEESVLQKELMVSLLQKKVEMIQISINRREPIDLTAIDSALEKEKQTKIENLEATDLTLHELPQLTEQQTHTIQRQYREITRCFHPAMNADITDTQKSLYEKAIEAYKMQDPDAMKLIYDMLFAPVDLSSVPSSVSMDYGSSEDRRNAYHTIATELSTDYKLAKKLYSLFAPLEEDSVMLDQLRSYEEQQKQAETQIESIRGSFPFTAESTINDPRKTEEYLAELRLRSLQAENRQAELEKKIQTMTEGIQFD